MNDVIVRWLSWLRSNLVRMCLSFCHNSSEVRLRRSVLAKLRQSSETLCFHGQKHFNMCLNLFSTKSKLVAELRERLEAAEEQNQTLLLEAQLEKEKVDSTLADYQTRIKKQEQENLKLSSTVEGLKKTLNEKDQHMEDMTSKYQAERQSMEKKFQALKENCRGLEKSLEEQKTQSEHEQSLLSLSITEMKQTLIKKDNVIESLETALAVQKLDKQKMEEDFVQKLSQKEAENKQLQENSSKTINDLEQTCKETKKLLQDALQLVSQYELEKQKTAECQRELDQKRQETTQMSSTITELEAALREQNTRIEFMGKTEAENRAQRREMEADFQRQIEEALSEKDEAVQSYETEISKLQTEKETLDVTLTSVQKELTELKKEQEEQRLRLLHKLDEFITKQTQLQLQLEEIPSEDEQSQPSSIEPKVFTDRIPEDMVQDEEKYQDEERKQENEKKQQLDEHIRETEEKLCLSEEDMENSDRIKLMIDDEFKFIKEERSIHEDRIQVQHEPSSSTEERDEPALLQDKNNTKNHKEKERAEEEERAEDSPQTKTSRSRRKPKH